MNRMEFLGRLARARESVERARENIGVAIQMACMNGCPLERENIDLSAYVATAIVNVDQAQADLEDLGQIFKPL